MKILISGICGFVGSTLARELSSEHEVLGFDSFVRPGSETNRAALRALGIRVIHADVRVSSDIDALPDCDWVIDAAANPSVLAGVDGSTSSRQLLEHNLNGTINLLEYCKARKAGFTLLSTSRVYSIPPLAALPIRVENNAFVPDFTSALGLQPSAISPDGVSESFSTAAPVSLYGATKLASEALALEYGETFSFPVWINRCGVLAGAGQFGKADQGIFSFWLHSWKSGRPLRYIGFGGSGHQVRDCLHPRDLAPILIRQMIQPQGAQETQTQQIGLSSALCSPVPVQSPLVPALRDPLQVAKNIPKIINLSGGIANSMSLAQLSAWCSNRFGPHPTLDTSAFRLPLSDFSSRPFDIPWMVLDPALAGRTWDWKPRTSILDVLEEIALHAEANPGWLDMVS
ncbi:MAG: NAD-dependent epimerase/dehydratase family protein [Terrimicrobiaceae bacterium]